MRFISQSILRFVIGLGCILSIGFGQPVVAKDYPDHPVRVVVPWPPGGLVDIAGRAAVKTLQSSLAQPFIIDNKVGAGGNLGSDAVAKSPADGYTLMLTTSALNINAALRLAQPTEVTSEFAPIALLAWAPSVLVASPALGVSSVQELIALAKLKPGKLTYASSGVGSPAHLSGELFKFMTGIDLLHVPYKGAPQAITDLISGQIDLLFAPTTVAVPQIKAGKVRPLAVTSAQRFKGLPDLPTMQEAGVPKFEADQWLGFFAPPGTPTSVQVLLRNEIEKAVGNGEVRAILEQNGMSPAVVGTQAEFAAFLKQDREKWIRIVKSANIPRE
ncbi:MAG: tripartite tricarboxylate transporter substrate binding protein [Betaproteobacteria bacterium]|nr:tripartite tricarboxylate transporter substrate binding protein [Betaproteobacteria bacterium]